jgi:long-chain fatty acid transport protein
MVGAAAVAIVIGTGIPEVLALGFRNPDQGAAATAQGNAFVAQADDATAVYYNPAGLTQIQGTEIANGGDLFFPDNQLKGAGSGAEMHTISLTPHMYATTDFGMKSPWRFGIGVNVPFGNEAVYSSSGPFQDIVTKADLQVINIQPTVAYQFNEHLSLGAGLNVYDAYTELNNHVAGVPDGHFHFDGDGVSFGATAGLLWKITPQHSVGVVYRSPFTANFRGPVEVKIPAFDVAGSHDALGSINFPQTVAAGYAFRPVPKLKLEADIEWTDWQTLNQLTLHAPGSMANGESIHFDWMASFLYEFGAQYELNEHWKVRGGFIYSENSVPDTTFSPSVPDSTRYVLSTGFGYTSTRFSIDATYQHTFADDRTVGSSPERIENGLTAADGTWQISANAVLITLGLKF